MNARIAPKEYSDTKPEARELWDLQIAAHGRMTQMKRTLAHSPKAFQALMSWYPIRDEVAGFLGERLTNFFVHAISTESDCLICSTFFRRLLIEAGEDPDHLSLDAKAQVLVDYGRQLARNAHEISDELFARLSGFFSAAEIVAITGLGAMMIATNLVNNALRVELDTYLLPYRKEEK